MAAKKKPSTKPAATKRTQPATADVPPLARWLVMLFAALSIVFALVAAWRY